MLVSNNSEKQAWRQFIFENNSNKIIKQTYWTAKLWVSLQAFNDLTNEVLVFLIYFDSNLHTSVFKQL